MKTLPKIEKSAQKLMAIVIKFRLGKNHRNLLLTDQILAIKISSRDVFPLTISRVVDDACGRNVLAE